MARIKARHRRMDHAHGVRLNSSSVSSVQSVVESCLRFSARTVPRMRNSDETHCLIRFPCLAFIRAFRVIRGWSLFESRWPPVSFVVPSRPWLRPGRAGSICGKTSLGCLGQTASCPENLSHPLPQVKPASRFKMGKFHFPAVPQANRQVCGFSVIPQN